MFRKSKNENEKKRKEQCLRFFHKNQDEIQKKTIWCNIRKGYFVWRKEIFERVRLTTAKRKKKRNQKEKKKKGVSQ